MWWIEQILWLLTIALTAILASRLFHAGLHKVYPWFFSYLIVRATRSLLLVSLEDNQTIYGGVWLYTEPLIWLLYVLIVLELCSLILNRFPGIATASSWAVTIALGVSITVSLLTLMADLSVPILQYPMINYYNLIRRGLYSSLVLFLVCMVGFLRWYPVPLSRNLVTHTAIFSVYFSTYAAGLLVRNLMGFGVTRTFSTVQQAMSVVCMVAWLVLLRQSGEARNLKMRPKISDTDEQRILRHLDALNASLLRTGRK